MNFEKTMILYGVGVYALGAVIQLIILITEPRFYNVLIFALFLALLQPRIIKYLEFKLNTQRDKIFHEMEIDMIQPNA